MAVWGMSQISIYNKKRGNKEAQGLKALNLGTKHDYLHHDKQNSALASMPALSLSGSDISESLRDFLAC